MAINNVTVANKAIVMIGANRISSFTDGSTEANVANDLYYDILDADLKIPPFDTHPNCRCYLVDTYTGEVWLGEH